jgi:exopolyphosphatase/guanosine-5'-triphosphate,3'-diphosphate pyrophosphatase
VQRFAAIDVGTNTVLLLVAERRPGGGFSPVVERAEITRLGRGVDRSGRLEPAAIAETVAALARFAAEARALGAADVACVATSAARDAANGGEFFDAARAAAGLAPEVISGDEEARLVYGSAWRDFGRPGSTLAVLDVGGGSTELVVGDAALPRAHASAQLGAVRLTERVVTGDPPPAAELAALRAAAAEGARALPLAAIGDAARATLVGVAGTVTTLAAVRAGLATYDAGVVHGSELSGADLETLYRRLGGLTVAGRAALPGMEPKRADVIVAGGAIVLEVMRAAGFDRLTVSDRGVRWGLIYDRFAG